MTDLKKPRTFTDVQKMKRGTTHAEKFVFPGTDIELGIRVLTQDEIVAGQNIARKKAKAELESPESGEIAEYALRELLFRACVVFPDEPVQHQAQFDPFFESPEQIGKLDMSEMELLADYYKEVQERYAPYADAKTPAEFDALIDEVKKKSSRGMSLDMYTLRKLLLYLVEKHYETSPTDNGSISTAASQLSGSGKKPPSSEQDEAQLPKKGLSLTTTPSEESSS